MLLSGQVLDFNLPVLERSELPGLAEKLVRELDILFLYLPQVLLSLLQFPHRHAPILKEVMVKII